jgi:dolichyl-phosphate-mannose-protein mannosyltransferase
MEHPPASRLGPPPVAAQGNEPQVEKRVEYRDDKGNKLNDEQVAELKGKVKFETKYETRTRILDAAGREIYEGPVGDAPQELLNQFAPPHPDVEGSNPETTGVKEEEVKGQKAPASVDAEADEVAERRRIEEEKKARPASEGSEATAEV